jgi:hypothetical protein
MTTNDDQPQRSASSGQAQAQLEEILVPKIALQMLLAAGWAVFKSAQRARITGLDAPDMGEQIALRNAITLAEAALARFDGAGQGEGDVQSDR